MLPSIHAEYDNGNTEFTDYWNWAGTSLPSGWTEITNNGGTIAVDNGLTITPNTAQTEVEGVYYSSQSFTEPSIMDSYSKFSTTTSTSWAKHGIGYVATAEIASIISTYNGDVLSYYQSGTEYAETGGAYDMSATTSDSYSQPLKDTVSNINNGNQNIWSVAITGTATQSYLNYSQFASESGTYLFTSGVTGYVFLASDQNGGVLTAEWTRIRTYPPDGIMPATTFNTIQTNSGSGGGSATLSISTNPATYGQGVTVTATCATGDSCAVDYPNPVSYCSDRGYRIPGSFP